MKTIKITPRGYCHGVVDAVNTITNLDFLSIETPVYILGMLVHNKDVIKSLDLLGVITLHDPLKSRMELLDEIDSGTVIFTAHGISPKVYQKAREKGLNIIDTTCEDVLKSQIVVSDYIKDGFSVIFVGKHGHPESEAAKGLNELVYVIENKDDIDKLSLSGKVAITNQTTMSFYDVFELSEYAKTIYPQIIFIDEICNATRIRQEAVINQEDVDHCFVVGDILSNNSAKLSYVAEQQANINSTLIENVRDINIEELKKYESVSVTSGASTPTQITSEVIEYLEQFDPLDESTHKFPRIRKNKFYHRKSTS